jgi:Zn-dependent protease
VDADFLVRGIVWYAVFVFSATAHEAAHGWAARRGGDSTAYLGGQVSLDPLPHIRREPFGMIVFPIVSFLLNRGLWMIGWASTPFNFAWALRHPRRAAWMSLAGPLANLTIAACAGIALRAGLETGTFGLGGGPGFHGLFTGAGIFGGVAMILSLMLVLNVLLFFFNLIPIPPLDGGSVITLFVSEDAARRIQLAFAQPMVAMAGMLFAWFFGGRLISPLVWWAVALVVP